MPGVIDLSNRTWNTGGFDVPQNYIGEQLRQVIDVYTKKKQQEQSLLKTQELIKKAHLEGKEVTQDWQPDGQGNFVGTVKISDKGSFDPKQMEAIMKLNQGFEQQANPKAPQPQMPGAFQGNSQQAMQMINGVGGDDLQYKEPIQPPANQYMGQIDPSTGKFGFVQNRAFVNDETKQNRDLKISEKQNQFDQRIYQKVIDKNNPSTAGRSGALGQAATANTRAQTAINTIDNAPFLTSQDLSNITVDLAGIYKRGVPGEVEINAQDYNSLQKKIANIKQYISANPQKAVSPEIKKKLRDTLLSLSEVNNKIIKSNFDSAEAAYKPLFKRNPDLYQAWKEFRNQQENAYLAQPENILKNSNLNKDNLFEGL